MIRPQNYIHIAPATKNCCRIGRLSLLIKLVVFLCISVLCLSNALADYPAITISEIPEFGQRSSYTIPLYINPNNAKVPLLDENGKFIDCGIASLAMIEGYFVGCENNSVSVYHNVLSNLNPHVDWDGVSNFDEYDVVIDLDIVRAIGSNCPSSYTFTTVNYIQAYNSLVARNPILIYRNNSSDQPHWAVIYGYSGSSGDSIDPSRFLIMSPTYSGTSSSKEYGIVAYQTMTEYLDGGVVTKLGYRNQGIDSWHQDDNRVDMWYNLSVNDASQYNNVTDTTRDAYFQGYVKYPTGTTLDGIGCFLSETKSVVDSATPSNPGAALHVSDPAGLPYEELSDGRATMAFYTAQGDLSTSSGFGMTLTPGTTYYYRFYSVRTVDGTTRVSYSDTNSFTTDAVNSANAISITPTTLDFGPQYLGLDAPLRRTITITNSGTTNITLNTNIHSENFIVESFSKTELSPGESATALVSFKCELPIGTYDETVNIQAVGNEDGQTVSIPLELKMESAYFEIPDRLLCESCFSKHTRIDKGQAYSYRNTEPIYNGDGTHTAEMSHYYQVICLDCGTESEMILSDSSIVSQDCIYNDQGICYICESSFLDCTHGMENYERVRWEHVYYTPTYSNETYHWQPYMLFYYYECSICGTEVIQSNQSNQREEVHYYHADGRCACGAEGEPSTCRHEDPRHSKIVEENVRYEDITAETHMKIADQYALEWCVDCGEMCSRDLWKKSEITVEGHSPVGGVCACGYRSEDISVYPDTIDFGVQYIGEEMPFRRLITITNSGTTDIELNTNVQSEYFIVESFSKEKLSSGESATAVVLFKVGMPAGACEEIVNIEATNDHLQTVVSIPLKLKIQHILIEMPLNPLCEYCQSDNTEVRSHWMIHDAVYNGDSTHTMDCSYCYLVNCLNCHEEYQKTLNRSTMSSFCGYSDQGVCYTCGHTYLACTHGKENYVKTGYEIEKYTPVFKDENYHFLPGTFFWCYECSICGAKARESYASTSEEEHYHYADGMCACGYKIGCKTHEFVNGVCSICGRPDLHSLNATLTLPANIKNIEMGAFAGSAAEAIIVPDGCLTIGERAFAQSEALKCVVLPGSVIEIAEDAFEGCVDLVIFAPQNSAAHIYAQKYGYIWYEK